MLNSYLLSILTTIALVGTVVVAVDNPSLPLPTPTYNPYCASSTNGDGWFAMVTVGSTSQVQIVAGNRQYYCNGTYNYPSLTRNTIQCGGYQANTQTATTTITMQALTFDAVAQSFKLVVRTRASTSANPDDVTLTGLTADRCQIAPINANGGVSTKFCGTVTQGDYYAQITTSYPFALGITFAAPFNMENACQMTGTYIIIDNQIIPLLSAQTPVTCFAWSVVSIQWDTTTLQPATIAVTATVVNQLRSFSLSVGSCTQLTAASYCGYDKDYRIAVNSYVAFFEFYAAQTGELSSGCTVTGSISNVIDGEPLLTLNTITGCVGLALQSMVFGNGVLTITAVVDSTQRTISLTPGQCGAIPSAASVCGVSSNGLMAAVNFGTQQGAFAMQTAGFGIPTYSACGISGTIVAVVNEQFLLSTSNGAADPCSMTQAPDLLITSMTFANNQLTIVYTNSTSTETIVATAGGCSPFAPVGSLCGTFSDSDIVTTAFVTTVNVGGSYLPGFMLLSTAEGNGDLQLKCPIESSGAAPFVTVIGTTVLGRLSSPCTLFVTGPMVYANGIFSVTASYNYTQYQFGLSPTVCGQYFPSYCGTTTNYSSYVTITNSSTDGSLTVVGQLAHSLTTGAYGCQIRASHAAIVGGRVIGSYSLVSGCAFTPVRILVNGVLLNYVDTNGIQFGAATAGTCGNLPSLLTYCSPGTNFYGFITSSGSYLQIGATRASTSVFHLSSYYASSTMLIDGLVTSVSNYFAGVIQNITTTNVNASLAVTLLNTTGQSVIQSFTASSCVTPQAFVFYCGVSDSYISTARYDNFFNKFYLVYAPIASPTQVCEVSFDLPVFSDGQGMYTNQMYTGSGCTDTPKWIKYTSTSDQFMVTVNNESWILQTAACSPLPNNTTFCGGTLNAMSIFLPNNTATESGFRYTTTVTVGATTTGQNRIQQQENAVYYPVAIGQQGYVLVDLSSTMPISSPVTYTVNGNGIPSFTVPLPSGPLTLLQNGCNPINDGVYCGYVMNAGNVAAKFSLVVDSVSLLAPTLVVSYTAPFAVSDCVFPFSSYAVLDNVIYTEADLTCNAFSVTMTLQNGAEGMSVSVTMSNSLSGLLTSTGCIVPQSSQYCGRWRIPGGKTGAALQLEPTPAGLNYNYGIVYLLPNQQCSAMGYVFFFAPRGGSQISEVLMTGTQQCLPAQPYNSLTFDTVKNEIAVTLQMDANTVYPTGMMTPGQCGSAPTGIFCASNAYMNAILTVTSVPNSIMSYFQLNATAEGGNPSSTVCTFATLVVVVDDYLVLIQSPNPTTSFCNTGLRLQMVGLGMNTAQPTVASAQVYVLFMAQYMAQTTSSINLVLAQGKCTTMPNGLYCGVLSSCCTRRSVIVSVSNGKNLNQQWATVAVSAENTLQMYPEYVNGMTLRGFAEGQALLDNSTGGFLIINSLSYAASAGVMTISGTVNNVRFFSTMDQLTSCGSIGSLATTLKPASMLLSASATADNQLVMQFNNNKDINCQLKSPFNANPSSGNVMISSPSSTCGSTVIPYYIAWNATSQTLSTAILLYGRYPLSYDSVLSSAASGNAAGTFGGGLSSKESSELSSSHSAAIVAAIAAVIAAIGVIFLIVIVKRAPTPSSSSTATGESKPLTSGPNRGTYSAPQSDLDQPMNPAAADSQA